MQADPVAPAEDLHTLDFIDEPHAVLSGPTLVGTEERWLVEFRGGAFGGVRAVVARLTDDLARDEALRRRYVRDVERVAELVSRGAWGIAPILAIGPAPDPRDPKAGAPFRVRVQPSGRSFQEWLARSPAPVDEIAQLGAALCDAISSLHSQGAVAMALRPENIWWTDEGRVVLTDLGLARVEGLSSRTASSLLLEASPYQSPEQVLRTVVDQRSDVYSVGTLLWHACTGSLPFGHAHALLREHGPLPDLRSLRPEIPASWAELLPRCIEENAEHRPQSVIDLAFALRGGSVHLEQLTRLACQHCGASVRPGQRLCVHCGRVAVRFTHLEGDLSNMRRHSVSLEALGEDAGVLKGVRDELLALSQRPELVPDLWLSDGVMTYAEDERRRGVVLPARLFSELDEDTAVEIAKRLNDRGAVVRVVRPDDMMRAFNPMLGFPFAIAWMATCAGAMGAISVDALLAGGLFFLAAASFGGFAWRLSHLSRAMADRSLSPYLHLRATPAALPASDPLVHRMTELVARTKSADIRERLQEYALLIQRLVDRCAELRGDELAEQTWVIGPVVELLEVLELHVKSLDALDAKLATLDDGKIVRALSVAQSKGQTKQARELLLNLDLLRRLEEERMAAYNRLLQAGALLRQAGEMGLRVQSAAAEHERNFQTALALLRDE